MKPIINNSRKNSKVKNFYFDNTVKKINPMNNNTLVKYKNKNLYPDLNYSRSGICSSNDNKIYIAGGYYSSLSVLNNFIEYDLTTGMIKRLAPMLSTRMDFSLVYGNDGSIYAIGGLTSTSSTSYTSSIEKYDFKKNVWTYVGSIPKSMFSMASVPYKNKIFIIGGSINSTATTGDIFEFDLVTKTCSAKAALTFSRSQHSVIINNDKIYTFGGYSSAFVYQIEEYNITNNVNTFDSVNTNPSQIRRLRPALVNDNNKIYIIAGSSEADGLSEIVYEYDVQNKTLISSQLTTRSVAAISSPNSVQMGINSLIYFPSNSGSYFRDSFEVGIYKPSDKPVLEYANAGDKVYGSESFLVGNQIIPPKILTTVNESGNVYYTGPEDYLFGYILSKA